MEANIYLVRLTSRLYFFSIPLVADMTYESFALLKSRYRVLNLMLLEVSLLRKRLWAVSALIRSDPLMHPDMVEQVPSFCEDLATAVVVTPIADLLFAGLSVYLNMFGASVGLKHFIVHLVLCHIRVLGGKHDFRLLQILQMFFLR